MGCILAGIFAAALVVGLTFAYMSLSKDPEGTFLGLSGVLVVVCVIGGFIIGITEPVTSPTFTILQEYEEGRIPLYHFDVYRIADVEEMDELGYEGYFYGDGVCLIEWASLIEEILPADCSSILIEKDLEKGFDYRIITVAGV